MNWIRMAVAGLALCAGASVASAQGPSGVPSESGQPGARGQGRGQSMLFEGITLTAQQQQEIDRIRAKYRAEREKTMPNGTGGGRPDEAARAKRSAMTDKQNAEIRATLNGDQQKVFDENAAEMKKRRGQMRSTQARS